MEQAIVEIKALKAQMEVTLMHSNHLRLPID